MKIAVFLLPCILLISFAACKHEPQTSEETTIETAPAEQNNPNLVANMNWTFLTHQLFHHRVTVASGKVDENIRKGHWIDFHENGKYDYGIWGEKKYEGQWTYNDTTKTLLMKPAGDEKPSEWRIMHRDEKLMFAGTATYGDNTQQIQWIRHEHRPDPNAAEE
jgi:hypothetical protein